MRRNLVHRDRMLEETGFMPARKQEESDRSFEHRKGLSASRAAKEYDLMKYPIPGTRALRYDLYEIQRKVEKMLNRIAA